MCAYFFFSSRRRHTRSYGDWSSDVCSSDLSRLGEAIVPALPVEAGVLVDAGAAGIAAARAIGDVVVEAPPRAIAGVGAIEIGRASCRERVWMSWVGG